MRRFRIATDDDVKRVEALPYGEFMPHGNVHAAWRRSPTHVRSGRH
ncbi:MAG: hypothetical protein M3Z29_07125 [Pseudomonadota bacterium]|nr:hypothetical protein [Pseudomonadota bacterium]